jgi:hypothetical protein
MITPEKEEIEGKKIIRFLMISLFCLPILYVLYFIFTLQWCGS